MNWAEKLSNEITNYLSESPSVKFNTHKNKKIIMTKISDMIIEAVKINAPNTVDDATTNHRSGLVITKPNVNPSVGHTVMTESMSSKGDEFQQNRK